MEIENRLTADACGSLLDRRRQPRFKFETAIKVTSRSCGSVKGHCVDISEGGISALLTIEVPSDKMVEVEFVTPFGPVTAYAMVRQRNAFRYGFQFVEPIAIEIGLTCRHLAKAAVSEQ